MHRPMNDSIPPPFRRPCQACPRVFETCFAGALYCDRCLLDRMLGTTHIPIRDWQGGAAVPLCLRQEEASPQEATLMQGTATPTCATEEKPPVPPALSKSALSAYRASAHAGEDQRETEAFLTECRLARRARARGLSGTQAAGVAVIGVAVAWTLVSLALSAWGAY